MLAGLLLLRNEQKLCIANENNWANRSKVWFKFYFKNLILV
jgi:hypothetical protein